VSIERDVLAVGAELLRGMANGMESDGPWRDREYTPDQVAQIFRGCADQLLSDEVVGQVEAMAQVAPSPPTTTGPPIPGADLDPPSMVEPDEAVTHDGYPDPDGWD
jgi:hypothetical protein